MESLFNLVRIVFQMLLVKMFWSILVHFEQSKGALASANEPD